MTPREPSGIERAIIRAAHTPRTQDGKPASFATESALERENRLCSQALDEARATFEQLGTTRRSASFLRSRPTDEMVRRGVERLQLLSSYHTDEEVVRHILDAALNLGEFGQERK